MSASSPYRGRHTTEEGILLSCAQDTYTEHHLLFRFFGIRFLRDAGLTLRCQRPDTYEMIGACFYEGKRPCERGTTVMFHGAHQLQHPYKPIFPERKEGRVHICYERVLPRTPRIRRAASKARLAISDRTRCYDGIVLEQHVVTLHQTVRIDAFTQFAEEIRTIDTLLRR